MNLTPRKTPRHSKNPYTQATIDLYVKNGWDFEFANAGSAKSDRDLFGFIDLLFTKNGHTRGVQSTSWGHHKNHLEKILYTPRILRGALFWLKGIEHSATLISWKLEENLHREQRLTEEYLLKQEAIIL